MKHSLIKKVNSNYVSYTINYLFILIINKVTVLPLKYKYIGKPGRNYLSFFFFFLQGIKTGHFKLDSRSILTAGSSLFYFFLMALDFYLLSPPCLWHLNF